jgi:hypothetical protein
VEIEVEASGPAEGPVTDAKAEALALSQASQALDTLGKTLKGRLQAEMSANGLLAAANVCADEAQALTAQVKAETGVDVGRTSLKLRNPANAGPDWATAWLTELGDVPAAQVTPSSEIAGDTARILRPLAADPSCLMCHGTTRPPELQAFLDERYPQDQAVDYAAGDLRGAMWASAPIDRATPGG